MKHKTNENFGLEGEFYLYKRAPGQERQLLFRDKNLITLSGKQLILSNIYTALGSADPISFAKVGTGGAFDIEGALLKSPTLDLTNLYSPQLSLPVTKSVESPSTPSITLVASVDNTEANGLLLNEAGFFSTSGKMFNIKTFPTTLKLNTFSLDIEWVIRAL